MTNLMCCLVARANTHIDLTVNFDEDNRQECKETTRAKQWSL
jgi:hypothetical protein